MSNCFVATNKALNSRATANPRTMRKLRAAGALPTPYLYYAFPTVGSETVLYK